MSSPKLTRESEGRLRGKWWKSKHGWNIEQGKCISHPRNAALCSRKTGNIWECDGAPHHRATTPSMALAVGGWMRLVHLATEILRLHFFGRLELRYGLARGWLQSLIFDTENQNAQKKQNFTKYVHFQMNEKWPKNAVFHYLSSGASIDLALPRSNLEPGSLSVHLLPAWGNKKDQVGLTSTARLISIIAGCWSVAKTGVVDLSSSGATSVRLDSNLVFKFCRKNRKIVHGRLYLGRRKGEKIRQIVLQGWEASWAK